MEWVCDLVNMYVKTAHVSDNWKDVIIVTIFKKKGNKVELIKHE